MDVPVCFFSTVEFLKTTPKTSVEDVKTTLETSGEDVKTTLETSGEDVKSTLETGGEDANLHSKWVGKIPHTLYLFFFSFSLYHFELMEFLKNPKLNILAVPWCHLKKGRVSETYGRIELLRSYRNLQSYWTTTKLWKLTVVLDYYEAMETYSRIGLLRSYGNFQSY